MHRMLLVVSVACCALLGASEANAAPTTASPGCEASTQVRLDWAFNNHAVGSTAAEQLRNAYKAVRLCTGDVIYQSGDVIRGPKAPGVDAPSSFRPTGTDFTKGGSARAARTTCSRSAYDPAFTGGQVRAGGHISCDAAPGISMKVCLGQYFQSSGLSNEVDCKTVASPPAVATILTDWRSCLSTISYRSNLYFNGSISSLYFNGATNGC